MSATACFGSGRWLLPRPITCQSTKLSWLLNTQQQMEHQVLLHDSTKLWGKGQKEYKIWVRGQNCEILSSRNNTAFALLNNEQPWLSTQNLHKIGPGNVPLWKRGVHKVPYFPEDLLAISDYLLVITWVRRRAFFFFNLFLYLFGGKGKLLQDTLCMSEGNFVESVFSFHLYVCSGDETHTARLAQVPLTPEPSCQSRDVSGLTNPCSCKQP